MSWSFISVFHIIISRQWFISEKGGYQHVVTSFGVKLRKEVGLLISALKLSFSYIFTAFNQNNELIYQRLRTWKLQSLPLSMIATWASNYFQISISVGTSCSFDVIIFLVLSYQLAKQPESGFCTTYFTFCLHHWLQAKFLWSSTSHVSWYFTI